MASMSQSVMGSCPRAPSRAERLVLGRACCGASTGSAFGAASDGTRPMGVSRAAPSRAPAASARAAKSLRCEVTVASPMASLTLTIRPPAASMALRAAAFVAPCS